MLADHDGFTVDGVGAQVRAVLFQQLHDPLEEAGGRSAVAEPSIETHGEEEAGARYHFIANDHRALLHLAEGERQWPGPFGADGIDAVLAHGRECEGATAMRVPRTGTETRQSDDPPA